MKKYGVVMLFILFLMLVFSLDEMPGFGAENNPSYNEVVEHYIDNNVEDTNSANLIASIITDYRAFDTLGETTVLFTAITAVVSVLGTVVYKDTKKVRVKKNG